MKRRSNVRQLSTIHQILSLLFSWSQPHLSVCSLSPSIHLLCLSVPLSLRASLSVFLCSPCLVLPPALTRWYWIDLPGRGVQDIISCSGSAAPSFPSPLSHWPPDGARFAWLGKQLGSITGQALVPCQYKCQQ